MNVWQVGKTIGYRYLCGVAVFGATITLEYSHGHGRLGDAPFLSERYRNQAWKRKNEAMGSAIIIAPWWPIVVPLFSWGQILESFNHKDIETFCVASLRLALMVAVCRRKT